MTSSTSASGPVQRLGLVDATAIIVGTVIGAGIYETTPIIAAHTSGRWELAAVFVIGGVCALLGALCYAELGTVLSRTGGDYEYLRETYGPRAAFMYAWMGFWVVQPAGLGAIAYIFARYASALHPGLTSAHFSLLAASAVAALTAANAFGLRSGTTTQKVLTAVKVLGILALIGCGFATAGASDAALSAAPTPSNLRLAFILVLYTYGGWNVVVLVAGEIKDIRRNLIRALVLGIAVTAAIYLSAVFAFEYALGHGNLARSPSAAAEVAELAIGEMGAVFISVLICVTCLANINATILTNSRVFYVLGRQWPTFAWLGKWDERLQSPINALTAQGVVAVILIFAFAAGDESFQRPRGI